MLASFAGRAFQFPSQEIRDQIESRCSDDWEHEIERSVSVTPRTYGLNPPKWPTPKLKLNQFFWPVGASRCAIFRGLMFRDDVQAIFNDTVGDDYDTLRLFDNSVNISTAMHALMARPVFGEGAGTLFVVTLVDRRFLARRSLPVTTAQAGDVLTSWSVLLGSVIPRYGTVTLPTINSVYGIPEADSALFQRAENPATIIDAAAANIGGVFLRTLSGNAEIALWSDIRANLASRTPTTPRMFGGTIYSLARSRRRNTPGSIVVQFPRWDDTRGDYIRERPSPRRLSGAFHKTHEETAAITALGSPYASLEADSTQTKALYTTAKALYDYDVFSSEYSVVKNSTQITNLARQLARNYYDFESVDLDAVYMGLINVDVRIGCDIIWELNERGSLTHIRRLPLDMAPVEFHHGFDVKTFPENEGGSGLPTVDQGCALLYADDQDFIPRWTRGGRLWANRRTFDSFAPLQLVTVRSISLNTIANSMGPPPLGLLQVNIWLTIDVQTVGLVEATVYDAAFGPPRKLLWRGILIRAATTGLHTGSWSDVVDAQSFVSPNRQLTFEMKALGGLTGMIAPYDAAISAFELPPRKLPFCPTIDPWSTRELNGGPSEPDYTPPS